MKDLSDQGVVKYTYRQHVGMAEDSGVLVKLDESTVVAFELGTRKTSQDYLDHMDLERIRSIMDVSPIDIAFD